MAHNEEDRRADIERQAGLNFGARTQIAGGLLERNASWRRGAGSDDPIAVLVELNQRHIGGTAGAQAAFRALCGRLWLRGYQEVGASYYRILLREAQVQRLSHEDSSQPPDRQAIYRLWPDYRVSACLDHSLATVKADAAQRAFAAYGAGITWAVVDSGIEAGHAHFAAQHNIEPITDPQTSIHQDFSGSPEGALTDQFGHGTHIAAIIAGGLAADEQMTVEARERTHQGAGSRASYVARKLSGPGALSGMAPKTQLVSLKVLDSTGHGDSSRVIEALQYLRKRINAQDKLLPVHGVNLSLGYEFEAEWFACGQSPLCVEVDKLVKAGVVVVVAAGNTGYGTVAASIGASHTGMGVTINDPGNADLAITVGSTHRDKPHLYGVSYFSSKGPTGDGRLKPDLVAPGERITSAAAGGFFKKAGFKVGTVGYIDESGTSQEIGRAHV